MTLKAEEKLCSLCGKRKAIYFRPYSGERLCRLCFIRSLERKVRRTISKYSMFNPDDRIALALSGGKDSLSLLQILHSLEAAFPKAELYAVTVNEGIKGYRDEAVEHAAEACQGLGVEHLVVSFKELFGCTLDEIVEASRGLEGAPSPCSYCGVLRRRALNLTAGKLEATKIATAHNLDDEVQTLILNLIHGDVYKLGRIDPESPEAEGFIPRVKPFRETPEAETAFYAYLTGVKFQSKPCPYAGRALRSEVRGFLNRLEAKHPGIKFTLYHSFEKLKPLVRGGVKAEISRCELCGEPSSKPLCEVCNMLSQLGKLEGSGKTN
jgi:uncharacterized protein (TIGR00269 family)